MPIDANIETQLASRIVDRMNKLREDISANIERLGLRASGKTQASLRVVQHGDEIMLVGRKFFSALQYGSSGWTGITGIKCTFQQFKAIIRQWISDKGLWFDDPDKASSAIASKIMREGTKLHRNDGYIDVYDSLIEEAIADIEAMPTGLLTTEIDNIIAQWARN